jgi:hypothetical protein
MAYTKKEDDTPTIKWKNRVLFLEKARGYDIVAWQDQINNTNEAFVTATQVFPIMLNGTQNTMQGSLAYSCFIYYKQKENGYLKPNLKTGRMEAHIEMPDDLKKLMEE